ncbi:MAG: hypothetical protein VX589_20140 [Myxococcota bacterium]|nr:hypothetical protein [Myxococcota bacterium]
MIRLFTIVIGLLAGCLSPSADVPELPTPSTLSRMDIRLAGDVEATPLFTQLTRAYAQERSNTIRLMPPLGRRGALMALEDGRLDGAIILMDGRAPTAPGCTRVARSPLVLALGPGIKARQFSFDDVVEIVTGPSSAVGPTSTTQFILRPSDDPLQSILSAYSPSLAAALEQSLKAQRWPIVAATEQPAVRASRLPGGIALALLGNLRLRALPVWTGTIMASNLSPIVAIHLCGLAPSSPKGKSFLEYLRSDNARQLISDFGFMTADNP